MTVNDLIQEIQAKNPQITQPQLIEQLDHERIRTNGLLSDETLLRLIAARLGIQVRQSIVQTCNTVTSGRLVAGLYDVNIAGCLIAVFPVKTFQSEDKAGKLATLILGDCDGLLRVVVWNEKTDLIEKGELKVGQTIRVLHGYTKEDRQGKIELHIGIKSLIETSSQEKTEVYPVERYTTKINAVKNSSGNVHIAGTVKAVLGKSGFIRGDDTGGVVMRLALRDDSGEVVVVVWNEKVDELERLLRESPRLIVVNARVKESNNGAVEIHVDSNTFISVGKEEKK